MANARFIASLDKIDRAEWLALRRQGLGSSDAPAILSWSPWSSPWQTYLDKVGEIPDDEPHEAMLWGNRLEDVIARAFADDTGHDLLDPRAMYQHHQHDWMLANPDRLIADDRRDGVGLLEVKNVTGWKADEWDPAEPDGDGVLRGGSAPAQYIAQVQHQHAVMGTRWGYLVALLGGNRLCVVEVPRADEFIAMLVATEEAFWRDHVEARVPPPIDGQPSTEELLKRMFAESNPDESTVLDDDLVAELARYHAAAEQVKQAEENKRQAGNRIRAALEDVEEGLAPDGETRLVTYRSSPRSDIDVDALKREMPEVAEKFTRSNVIRSLRPSRSKAARAVLAELNEGA